LVLIKNSLLAFHIRTQVNVGGWSGIVEAAIKIGSNTLVVQEQPSSKIFVNTVDVTSSPPATFAGYIFSVLPVSPVKIRLDLGGGQYIELTRAYANTLQVDVLGDGADFGDSEGLCANWTANSPNALVDRDKFTVYPLAINPNVPYGEEWRVDSTMGDPLLFPTPAAAQCNYTQPACGNRDGGAVKGCDERAAKAKQVCVNVPTERNAQKNCEFDVIQTDDAAVANTTAYTDPLIGNPPARCVEVETSNPNVTSCGKRGGRCVWRCNDLLFNCVKDLCKGPDQGCTCAVPKVIEGPVTPPVKAPVKPPVKPPTRRGCGLFGLGLFCFNGCGLLRFLGFCAE
jgi:hypothetical protein